MNEHSFLILLYVFPVVLLYKDLYLRSQLSRANNAIKSFKKSPKHGNWLINPSYSPLSNLIPVFSERVDHRRLNWASSTQSVLLPADF